MKRVQASLALHVRALDRVQQAFAVDGFRENFRARNFEPLLGGRVIREEHRLQTGKDVAERRAEGQAIDAVSLKLRDQERTTRDAARPIERAGVRDGEAAVVLGVFRHHLHQLLSDLSVVVDDEQLHYGDERVSGGGKRFSNFVGSARTSCS